MPDVAPTILSLAGVDPGSLEFDGRSAVGLLQQYKPDQRPPGGAPREEAGEDSLASGLLAPSIAPMAWRDAFLVEYLATEPGVKYDNFNHVVDNGNNTFRGLRILNADTNLAYFEFTDDYTDWGFERPSFYELYDAQRDPEQLYNIYANATEELKKELAARLAKEYQCKADTCA